MEMIFFFSCFSYHDLYVLENCVPVIFYLHLILPGYNPTLSYLQAGTREAPWAT